MGFGFLPLEKIPIFIWGIILLLIGGFLLFNSEYSSWDFLKAVFLSTVGVAVFIYDIKKRCQKSKVKDSVDKS